MIFVFLLLLVMLPASANAALQPLSQRVQISLADGQQWWVTTHGTENNLWVTTESGRDLVEQQGRWFYAAKDEHGRRISSGELVLSHIPLAVMATNIAAMEPGFQLQQQSSDLPQRIPFRADGSRFVRQPLLVVRVSFTNQGFRYSDAEIARSLFAEQDSVKQYFLENSYDNFEVVPVNENSGTANDGIVSVQLGSNHPDFGTGYGVQSQNLARTVLASLPSGLNLGAYDRNGDQWLDPNELAIVFLVAGYEQAYAGAGTSRPRIWAHKSSLYRGSYEGLQIGEYAMFGERHQDHQATIGIICHELGHLLFDLPDLYDRYGKSMGIGRWGLMGLGGWNSSAGHAGNKPAHMLAWSKEQVGFVHPGHAIEGYSTIRLRALSNAADVLEIPLDGYRHGQRLLLEHRRLQSFDAGLPGEGILMTRINDWVGYGPLGGQNDNVSQQLVDVEEADGSRDLDENRNRGDADDVFSSSQNTLIFSAVSPGPAAEQSAVELLRMETGLVADIDLRVASAVYGDNIGLDEVGPNEGFGVYGGAQQVIIKLPISSDVVWLDGVDWYALGAGLVDVALYRDDPLLGAEALRDDIGFSVAAGWNRLMLSQRLANNGFSHVFIKITARSSGDHQPLVIDTQGAASGDTRVRQSDGQFAVAPFDVSARLLVMNSDTLAAPDLGGQGIPISSAQGSSGSASGGALSLVQWFSFWLLAVLVMRRRPV